MISTAIQWAAAHPVPAAVLAVAALALAAGVVALISRAVRVIRGGSRARAATVGLLVPAGMALGMSADTSWRFIGSALGITAGWERALLCGVAEAGIVALTVYAWATRTKGPAYLAYAAVLVQVVPAFQVSGGLGGITRAILGPVLLAVLLHLLLGLELRMSGARPDGLAAAALRELRERLTASLGIGRRGEDSAAIARSRAADRAVRLADRLAVAEDGSRAYLRASARLAAAIDAARHGLEAEAAEAAEAAIVARVIRRRSVAALATIETRHDWTGTLERNTGGTPGGTLPVPAEPGPEPLALEAVPVAEAEGTPGRNPGGTPALEAAPVAEAEAEHGRNGRNTEPAPARADLAVVRNLSGTGGTRADHIRALVAEGVTETGTIRNTLEAAGVPVPSDRYIRRVVTEARNTGVPATGTRGYM